MGKKKHEEHENHERWLVSYADFITLLFAFFTVLYATSQTDQAKLEAVMNGMNAAFEGGLVSFVGDSSSKDPPTSPINDGISIASASNPTLEALRSQLHGSLSDNVVEIGLIDNTMNIELPENVLFDSGSAEIHPVAYSDLTALAEAVRDEPVTLEIIGHADGAPISGPPFLDNWGLASARSLAVARYMGERHVGVDRLKIGAEITANTDPQRRAVTFRIRSDDHAPTASVLDKLEPAEK